MALYDVGLAVAAAAVVAAAALSVMLLLRTRRFKQLADEATRLREQAEAVEQRNRQLKQEMTNNIAHELKTPVSSIRGYLEILLGDKPIDDNRRRHFLERCYSQTLRLSDLIQDVSLINKLEENADLFPKENIDVVDVMHDALDGLADRADARHITLDDRLLSPMPLCGSRELVFCIFRNLIENTVAYAGEGVQIVVETYKEAASHYYLHYFDTGCGVPDEYLARLFDRFVRIGDGRSRADGGTGLGLSIVKHAVIFHGGEIYARNRSEGGLEFFFSLGGKLPVTNKD